MRKITYQMIIGKKGKKEKKKEFLDLSPNETS